jgi:hypothetical protein
MKVRRVADTDEGEWLELRRALWPDCHHARHSLDIEQWQCSDGVVLLGEGRWARLSVS